MEGAATRAAGSYLPDMEGSTEGSPHRNQTERTGFLVEGRVQGVGFRWWTVQTARRLGLRGTVRNRRDGRVEVHVEGPPAAVAGLEELLAEGPSLARVDAVRRIDARPELPPDFRVVG